jgi:hypothetical protein
VKLEVPLCVFLLLAILVLPISAHASVLDPKFNYPPEREAEILQDTNTVIGYMETLGYPSFILTCYTLEFKEPFSSENCKINESTLKNGFNIENPNDYVNEFCEKMRFFSKEIEFKCLSAAIQVYGDRDANANTENEGEEEEEDQDQEEDDDGNE